MSEQNSSGRKDPIPLIPQAEHIAFDSRCEAMAKALQKWTAVSSDVETRFLVRPVLELMRANRSPDPSLVDRAREALSRLAGTGIPRFDEIEAFVRSPEQLEVATGAAVDWTYRATGAVCVKFLASEHGGGWLATISYAYGPTAPDGWHGVAAGLRGVALLPEPDEFERRSWLTVAVQRLEAQGVRFLTAPEAVDYMEHDGARWLRRWKPEPETGTSWDRLRSAIRTRLKAA